MLKVKDVEYWVHQCWADYLEGSMNPKIISEIRSLTRKLDSNRWPDVWVRFRREAVKKIREKGSV